VLLSSSLGIGLVVGIAGLHVSLFSNLIDCAQRRTTMGFMLVVALFVLALGLFSALLPFVFSRLRHR
jgi:hypothetical protein